MIYAILEAKNILMKKMVSKINDGIPKWKYFNESNSI